MGFKGDLRNIGLSDVFQNIASNRLQGTLRIYDEKEQRFIYFHHGEVVMASRGKRKGRMTEILVREGKITEKDRERLIKRHSKSPKDLPEILGEMKVMKPDDFRARVRRHVEEEVYEVFAWRTALFEFIEGEPPPDLFDPDQKSANLSIAPTSIIMEAARRLDEWEKIGKRIPSLREIVILASPLPAGGEPTGDKVSRAVLDRVDGRRSVQAIVDSLPHTKFEVCLAVSSLLEAGVLRPLSEFERVRLAENQAAAGRTEEALEIFRLSLEVDRSNHDIRRKHAALLEQTGRKEEAASEVKILAHLLIEGGNREGALGAYQWAVTLSPSDTVAREKLYSLRKEMGEPDEIIQAGRDLAQLYRKVGLTEKARDLYLELVETYGEDPDLEEFLAKTYLELGETRSAAARYRSVARLHLNSRNYDEAAEIYEQILKIDPDNPEAQKIIVEIREGRIALRKQRLRSAGVILVFLVGSAAVIAWMIYEGLARRSFHDAHMKEIAFLQNGNVSGAIGEYREVSRDYPYSFSSAEARSVMGKLASWQIDRAQTSREIAEVLELDLPLSEATREKGEERREHLRLRELLADYERLKDDERGRVREGIAGIRDPRAAGGILLVHREIRGRAWAAEINDVLLKALDGINDKPSTVPRLLVWLDEVDQDYDGDPALGGSDRRKIRRILSRLILGTAGGAETNDEALRADFWRREMERQKP